MPRKKTIPPPPPPGRAGLRQFQAGQKYGRVKAAAPPRPDAEGRATEGGMVILSRRLVDDFVILTDSNRLLAVPPKLQKGLAWMQRVTVCYLFARETLLAVAPEDPP